MDELARRLEALVQVDRADHRLERVSQDREPLPAARLDLGVAHEDETTEPHRERPSREDRLRDEQRLRLGEVALVLLGVLAVEVFARHEPEDGIAEELETLVRLARPLSRHAQVRPVGERELQEVGVAEGDAEVLLELLECPLLLLGAGARTLRRTAEELLQPGEESGLLGRRRLGAAAPHPAASAAAARAASQLAARIASVTLCPPNPNEFEIAAVTWTLRA